MRPSRLIILAILIATLAVVLWPAASRVMGRANGRSTLLFTVWGMPFEDRLFLDRYAKGWERLNPSITVDYQRLVGDGLLAKYNAWAAQGRGADVMRLRITDYLGMVERGMLEPLDDFISDPDLGLPPDELADFPPQIMQLLRIVAPSDGPGSARLYALPQDNAQYGLFYNRAIFAAYNRDHSDSPAPYPSPDWTWHDLRRVAKMLTTYDDRGRIDTAGIDFFMWSWPFLTFHAQAGGELWTADGLTTLINHEPGVRALEFLRTLQREDRSLRISLGDQTGTGPDALFAAGRTAIYLDGSWRVPNFEANAPSLDFAVAPLPRGVRPAVVSGSVLWGISSHSRNKREAWRMLRWLVAKEQSLEYWDTLRVAPPARMSLLTSDAFRTTRGLRRADGSWEVPPLTPGRFEARAGWLAYANTPHPETGRPPGFVPVAPYQTELEREIERMLSSYLNPSSTESAQSALDRVAAAVHAIIDRDRAAKGLPAVVRPVSR
ncbi:MAG: sugar ABC transporter substrate-binding protein [Phycisphaerales bacterium]|nr:sugar ABC transporter substrate-binding protein [Phycisphaerales bacterium]